MREVIELFTTGIRDKWDLIALFGAFAAFCVRVIKDPKVPIPLPPRYRPLLGMLVGIICQAFLSWSEGESYKQALVNGLMTGVMATIIHVYGFGAAMGGKELPLPFLKLCRPSPGDDGDPPKKPGGPPPFTTMMLGLMALILTGCADFQKLDKAFQEMSAEVRPLDDSARAAYEFNLTVCGLLIGKETQDTCFQKADEAFAPIRKGMQKIRKVWCEAKPEDPDCKNEKDGVK